jgi:CMP-N-acetylneuraminic acid synthetase
MNLNAHQLVALLPMKAHSARIPGKNFRSFAGKPLFRWILDTLLSMKEIDLIVINTDARLILKEHGLTDSERVLIRDRKLEICGDLVNMNLVLSDDLAAISAETYLMTHATNPLLSASTIRDALRKYRAGIESGKTDSLLSVDRYQTRFYREDGSPVNHNPANLLRTQDLEPWFAENSNIYIFSQSSFSKTKARVGQKPLLFETPRVESVDIDDDESWDIAERLISQKLASQKGCLR